MGSERDVLVFLTLAGVWAVAFSLVMSADFDRLHATLNVHVSTALFIYFSVTGVVAFALVVGASEMAARFYGISCRLLWHEAAPEECVLHRDREIGVMTFEMRAFAVVTVAIAVLPPTLLCYLVYHECVRGRRRLRR